MGFLNAEAYELVGDAARPVGPVQHQDRSSAASTCTSRRRRSRRACMPVGQFTPIDLKELARQRDVRGGRRHACHVGLAVREAPARGDARVHRDRRPRRAGARARPLLLRRGRASGCKGARTNREAGAADPRDPDRLDQPAHGVPAAQGGHRRHGSDAALPAGWRDDPRGPVPASSRACPTSTRCSTR